MVIANKPPLVFVMFSIIKDGNLYSNFYIVSELTFAVDSSIIHYNSWKHFLMLPSYYLEISHFDSISVRERGFVHVRRFLIAEFHDYITFVVGIFVEVTLTNSFYLRSSCYVFLWLHSISVDHFPKQ